MKILRFDSVGGASGDMILGALLGLGVDVSALREQLLPLVDEPFDLVVEPFASHGLNGMRLTVRLGGAHGEGHGAGGHGPGHGHGAGGDHGHRSFREIRDRIRSAGLPGDAAADAVEVFRLLAEAEGLVHGRPAEEVHFHEVGATDSIVDIVGSCLARRALGVARVETGPLPVGRGTVRCRHGVYPVPAPATMGLLSGMIVESTDENHELVTPTGAALLRAWCGAGEGGGTGGTARVVRSACSFGHRALDTRPNVLRATLMEAGEPAGHDRCMVLETNLDDTTPELVGTLCARLMEQGALDVFTVPAQMKKQRPGVLLTVLCEPSRRSTMLDAIFRGSTTFGVRCRETGRVVLDRKHVSVDTPYGAVRMKIGTWQGEEVTQAPEMEDCLERAREHGVSARRVYEEALRRAGR